MATSGSGDGLDHRQVYQSYPQILPSTICSEDRRGGVILGLNFRDWGRKLAGNLCLCMGASLVEYRGAIDRPSKLFCREKFAAGGGGCFVSSGS